MHDALLLDVCLRECMAEYSDSACHVETLPEACPQRQSVDPGTDRALW